MNDERVMRNGHELSGRPEQGLPSSEPNIQNATVPLRPGILIFSHRRQLLHMNGRALELTGHPTQAEGGPANVIHLASVNELSAQIQDALDSRREANTWGLFELKRVICDAGRKILVRGFGLAGRNSHDYSRIVILLEELEEIDLPQRHLRDAEVGLTV